MKQINLKEIAQIKFCTITPSRSKPAAKPSSWLLSANFFKDNQVDRKPTVNYVLPENDWLLCKNDIVIKRIAPTFVNYIDEISPDIYCGNNLIIITPNNDVDAKYLAMILNEQIGNISAESSVGAVMKSVSRIDLETLTIPFPDKNTQHTIGLIWYNSIELKKKKVRLAELENMRINYLIDKSIHITGGKNNG